MYICFVHYLWSISFRSGKIWFSVAECLKTQEALLLEFKEMKEVVTQKKKNDLTGNDLYVVIAFTL